MSELTQVSTKSREVHGYLADVIARIVNGHPQSRIDDILPWAYPDAAKLRAVA